ncbi:MAG TPA: flotillin domain-containing protein, partial [Thermoanaerobaculia bacterium]
ALTEAYRAEEESERQRGAREEATQVANVVVPAEIKKREIEVLAEAEAERVRRTKKGEADGLRSLLEAEAAGIEAMLSRKAQGFERLVAAAQGQPELASLLLVVEQLPKLVEEQVKAISNLKIDQVTVWDGGRNGDGKTATADFLSGLVASLPPLHDLTKNVGVKLPEYLGRMERGSAAPPEVGGGGGGDLGPGGGAGRLRAGGKDGGGRTAAAGREAGGRRGGSGARAAEGEGDGDEDGAGAGAARPPAAADAGMDPNGRRPGTRTPGSPPESAAGSPMDPDGRPATAAQKTRSSAAAATPAAAAGGLAGLAPEWLPKSLRNAAEEALAATRAKAEQAAAEGGERLRLELRRRLAAQPGFLRQLDRDADGRVDRGEIDVAVDAALAWAARVRDAGASWYYAESGETAGPAPWGRIRELGSQQPALPINLDGAPLWLPFEVVEAARSLARR